MTYPKLKPCPRCGNEDIEIYTYESGWKHVERTRQLKSLFLKAWR